MPPYPFRSAAPAPVRCSRTVRRSAKSSSSSCRSSQYLKTSARTPAWVSFRSSTFASNSGPNDDTVARSCAPRVAARLRNSTGNGVGFHAHPVSFARCCTLSSATPATPRPERSPFMSARNTGTPAADSCSARSWRVLVLPVPVAPAMRPWRFIMASGMHTSGSGAHSFPDMGAPRVRAVPVLSNAARHAASSFASMEGDPPRGPCDSRHPNAAWSETKERCARPWL